MSVAMGSVFSPDYAFFFATKAAVDTLVKHWAVALGGRKIRANSVASGVIAVNFRAALLKDPAFRLALERDTALGRAGRVSDVTEVVSFLASKDAQWITGSTIQTSGGWRL